MNASRLLASLAVLLALAGPVRAEAAPGEGFDVVGYDLFLSPDVQTGTVVGRETITLRILDQGLQRLAFSGNALVIDSASVDGAPVTVRSEETALGVDLQQPLAKGTRLKLTLTYHGQPRRGLVRSPNALHTRYFACDWMVCAQDQFGDKAAFRLELRIPAGLEALAVGRRVARRAGAEGGEIQTWRTPRPYPAYLFGFAMGRFARAEDRVGSTRLSYLSDVASPAELKRRFAGTAEMVRFLSDKAGARLPADDYGQLLVAGDEAQEQATYAVLGVEALPAKADDPAEDWAIVHELAHQWWGNLVTCASLRDFWLNEGITTFMTAAWKEHRYGRAAYDAELAVARRRLDKARTAGFDKPLAWDGAYPSLGVRRAIQYSKGALFMDHLRGALGEKAFWAGLRRYTRAHAGGVVTSLDLQKAMEASSGRDLGPLFAEWVFGSATPATAAGS